MNQRFAAQLLSGQPARSVLGVVDRLLAVQGQDPRGVRLAVRARSVGLTAADVDRALTVDRSVIITWLNRGTLHLVRTDDYWWLRELTTPPLFSGNARRLAQEGVSPQAAERGVAAIEQALRSEGPLTRAQLRDRVAAADVRVQGQALVHVLVLASLRGLTVRGPIVDGDHAYVLVSEWLDPPPGPVDRDVALAELARRYLAGHGPADDRDLAKWAGIPLRDARRGLTAIGDRLGRRDDGLLELARPHRTGQLPPPRLLGAFDPLLLGWAAREWILGGDTRTVTVNGLFRPFALVRGRAVATWTMAGRRVAMHPFHPIDPADAAALDADAADVARFLGQGQAGNAARQEA